MFNKVSVLFAYQPDNGPRDSVFKWIKRYYKSTMPGIELCIGHSKGELFNRSQGMNSAANMATRDIFVIADGDIIYNPQLIIDAIKALNDHAWVIPYHNRKIHNVSEKNTITILESNPQWPMEVKIKDFVLANRDHNFPGKLNVIKRENFFMVGGFDERFEGYGWEDHAFANAVKTICGPPKRLNHNLYHLFHPKVKAVGNPVWEKNKILGLRYKSAFEKKDVMYKLINERNKAPKRKN